MITELKNKSDKELENLGYSEEKIEKIKAYDGSYISLRVAFSDFSCRIYFNRHKYDSSDRETTFRVRFDWEWEERPATALTDIIGAIVSEDMYWDDELSYHKVNYYHYSGSDDYVEVFDFEPTDEIHAMQTNI